jgi:putative DNA primase/helicase
MNTPVSSGIALPLPQRPEAERSILGAVLVDGTALQTINHILQPTDFFTLAHRHIFSAMQRLQANGQPVELVTLYEALRDDSELIAAGGAPYLASLGDGIPRHAPITHWAALVRNAAVLRTFAYAGEEMQRIALEPRADLEDAIQRAQTVAQSIASFRISTGNSLTAVSVEELLAKEIKPREMLLDPILPEQGLVLLYAYRGIGKTFLALGIAAAVASGTRFLRWSAPRPRRVLYVDGELPASTIRDRLAMILGGMEEGEPAPDMLRIITPDLQDRPMPDLATPEGQRLLEPLLDGIDLLVLDNLSALCRDGKENEGEAWLPVQEWALRLRRRGISVLFVHHAGKNRSQRGTSRREDLLDTVITLKHPPDYDPREGLRCEVHFEKTRSMLGDAAKPFEVKLESGPDGQAVWTHREVDDTKAEQAVALFSAQLSVRDVAEELGISKSQAGRLRQMWTAKVSRCPAT